MNYKTPALIAALTLTASASFASSDENNLVEDYLDTQAHVHQLSDQLDANGMARDTNGDYNTATLNRQLDAYQAELADLESQFDSSHNTVTTQAN